MKKTLLILASMFIASALYAGKQEVIGGGGGGSGSGTLNPAVGIDTVLALGENSAQSGLNSVATNIDSGTDVKNDIDRWVGPTGQTFHRWYFTFIDDTTMMDIQTSTSNDQAREPIRWFISNNDGQGGNIHDTANTNSETQNNWNAIFPFSTGKLRAETLSFKARGTVAADKINCDLRVMIEEDTTKTTLVTNTIDDPTGDASLTYCAGAIHLGETNTSNSGGWGDTTNVGRTVGSGYTINLGSDCVCDDSNCHMYVVIQESASVADECEDINDGYVAFSVSEDYP